MKEIQYWIQRADFTTEDLTASGAAEIQKVFRNRSWAGELHLEQARHGAGDDSCPPGLGINFEDGRFLHICPEAADLLVHYHYNHERRVFGIFPTRSLRIITESVPYTAAEGLIACFVNGDHEGLLKILKGK